MKADFPIDSELLERASQFGGEKTIKAIIEKALREFITHREQVRMLDLFGKLEWDEEYDYKIDRLRQ